MTVALAAAAAFAVLVGPWTRPVARPVRHPGRRRAITRRAPAWIPRRGRSFALVAALVAAVLVTAGPTPALAIVVALAAWPSARRVLATRAHQRRVDAALPDAIEMLILVVHAGLTPHQAIVMLSERAPRPIRPALHEVRRRVSRGAPLAEALRALPERLGPGAAVVADTLAMAERYGTPIGQALEQLALDVRERRRHRADADARKLPIRMAFPLVCCTLPSFVLIAIVPAVLAALSSLGATGV